MGRKELSEGFTSSALVMNLWGIEIEIMLAVCPWQRFRVKVVRHMDWVTPVENKRLAGGESRATRNANSDVFIVSALEG